MALSLSGFVCLCFLFPYVCVSVYLCVFPFFSLVSLESLSLKSSNRVSGELKGVSRMFQGRFKGVSRKIKGCFKEDLSRFKGYLKEVQSYFRKVSKEFQGS